MFIIKGEVYTSPFLRKIMSFNDFDNDIALERQIRLVMATLENVTEGFDYYNFRCHVCGDSKKSKSKKRGYILKKRKPWVYFCHNCFYKKPVVAWLKEFFPSYYRAYYSELLRTKDKKQDSLPTFANPKIKKKSPESEHTKHFIHILNGEGLIFEKSIKLCIDRNIPEIVWQKWFVATGGMYKNRLIIPFFDKEGKIYYYQGRSLLDNMTPKYLSRAGDYNSVYNYYLVDKSQPVPILEGPIDSIFVENSIAVTGVKIDDKKLEDFPNRRFLIDYDGEGADNKTKLKVIELLSKGEYVFCWKKFIKEYRLPNRDKWDVNDVLLYLKKDKFTFKEIEPFFTNNLYDKIYFI